MKSTKSKNIIANMKKDACSYVSNEEYVVTFKGSSKVYADSDSLHEYLSKKKMPNSEASSVIEDILIHLSKNCNGKKKKKDVIDEEEDVNSYTRNVLWWLSFIFADKTNKKFVVKNSPKRQVYTMSPASKKEDLAESVLDILMNLEISLTSGKDKNLKDYINAKFKEQFTEEIYGYTSYITTDSDGNTKLTIPSIDTYLRDNITKFGSSSLFLSKIKPVVLTNHKDVHAYNYIDLERIKALPIRDTPRISEWLDAGFTKHQQKVIMAYMFSIINGDHKSRQGLYIEDQIGKTGKTTFLNAFFAWLSFWLGDVVQTLPSNKSVNQFTYSSFYGKVLGVDTDVKNPSILQSEMYHKLTGGDMCTIEYKGQGSFSSVLKLSMIMAGNITLDINTAFEHEMSRIIYIQMGTISEDYLQKYGVLGSDGKIKITKNGSYRFRPDDNCKEEMVDEMDYYMRKCYDAYMELSGGGEIEVHESIIEDTENRTTSDTQSAIEDFYYRYIVKDESTDSSEESYILSTKLKEIYLKVHKRATDFSYGELKKFIEVKTKGEIVFKRKEIDGKKHICLVGGKINIIELDTLFYQDDIKKRDFLGIPQEDASPKEEESSQKLQDIKKLVNNMKNKHRG